MRWPTLIVALILSSCASNPPQPTPCNIFDFETAECVPTDPSKPRYEVPIEDLLGYSCLSPDDQGDVKKYIQEVLERWGAMNLRPDND